MYLIRIICERIWKEYTGYTAVKNYIKEFQEEKEYDSWGGIIYNFEIHYKNANTEKEAIDLTETLTNMPQDDLFRIAIDLGISVPMVIPAFPTFVRTLAPEEKGLAYAQEMFNKAYRSVQDDPEQAVGLANSTLETIIKHILQDPRSNISYKKNDSLYKLTENILKEFKFFPTPDLQINIRNIGSSLLCISKEIENLRSDKTFFHGKEKGDYVVDNGLYAMFIVNTISTVGLFIISYFEEKYGSLKSEEKIEEDNDIPF